MIRMLVLNLVLYRGTGKSHPASKETSNVQIELLTLSATSPLSSFGYAYCRMRFVLFVRSF